MFHRALPAAVLCLLTHPALADELNVPGLSPDAPAHPPLPLCENRVGSTENCVRILACVGNEGLWFDGQAWGWDTGTIIGYLSTGEACQGTWTSCAWFGGGESSISCTDGTKGRVYYLSQDGRTGTVIGNGVDNHGRHLKVWTGTHVLEFLSKGGRGPELPCTETAIPIS